jgi:putative phosphoribosyl transferase
MTIRMASRDEITPVRIPLDDVALDGDLHIPKDPVGLIIFAHGSGSSRLSPRNRHLASELNRRGMATLLMDLLTEQEHKIDEETMEYRFDIPLLGMRSTMVVSWAQRQPEIGKLPIGLFGASTGTAAALITAAELRKQIAAVVSRGGRPDLAESALPHVTAPTLLIVGGNDEVVLKLNRQAMDQMSCPRKLSIVPGATHLFEESGALQQVATLATEWFLDHMHNAEPVTLKQVAAR